MQRSSGSADGVFGVGAKDTMLVWMKAYGIRGITCSFSVSFTKKATFSFYSYKYSVDVPPVSH